MHTWEWGRVGIIIKHFLLPFAELVPKKEDEVEREEEKEIKQKNLEIYA